MKNILPFQYQLKKKMKMVKQLKFIDTYRFMQSKLSDLADNLLEINNRDCIKCRERKKIDQNVIYRA